MGKLIALLALAVVGCASPVDVPAGTLVLSPSPEAEPATRAAAERWSRATGVEIVIGPGGVPVEYVADAVDPQGYRVCAYTLANYAVGPLSMAVDDSPPSGVCRAHVDTMAHEVGHALCHHYQPGANCHVDRGLMRSDAQRPEDSVLDAESLARVCEFVPCVAFNPEQ